MVKILNFIKKFIDMVQIIFISTMVLVIGFQIISRKFFNKPLDFPEELSMFILITIVFLGVNIVEINNNHVKIEFILKKSSNYFNKIIKLLSKILTFIVIIAIMNGEKMLFPRIVKLRTTAADIPYSWLHSIIILSCITWLSIVSYDIVMLILVEKFEGKHK